MGVPDTANKTSHTNHIQLNLEVILSNGTRLLFYERLYPWQETPNNFQYKIFKKKNYDHLYVLNGSMKKLKKKLNKILEN